MKQAILSFFLAALALTAQAKVRLPHILSDGMVLQQQATVKLWGWDKAGRQVTVTPSWDGHRYTATTDKDGRWMVSITTPRADHKPYTVTFDDGDRTVVNGVLMGEVWVCAGQSNMEVTMSGFNNCPVEGYNEEMAVADDHSDVHFVKIPSVMSMRPLDDAQCRWEAVSPQTLGHCSAVGYYFARMVSHALRVPVGLVLANKGGSRVESWLSEDNLRRHTDEPLDSMQMVKRYDIDYIRPLLWGNGTFHPILHYTAHGILFYQGCSNVDRNTSTYAERLKILVEQWRKDMDNPQMPFYMVQIAPYAYGDGRDGVSGALLREQQMRAADLIPHAGIVGTNDCVYPWESAQIHPCQKRPVGERLARMALNRDYGFSAIQSEGMRYESMTIEGDTCYLKMKNTYGGISRMDDIQGFEVAGEDRVFHPAKAGHFWVPRQDPRNETVFVTSPEVKRPVAVRYCFRNFQLGNLCNNALLPLFPFRTDHW
jgi:sialate O-acetylesterase